MVDTLIIVLAVASVAFIGYLLYWSSNRTKTHKRVDFLRPRDKRGESLEITRETDHSVICEQSNPIHRFIKIGPAFNFKDGGRHIIKFFGIEASAYTASLRGTETFQIPVQEFLQHLWGNKIYNALPTVMKEAVEKDKIGVTIEPVKVDSAALGLEQVSSDEVNDEADATILERLARFGSSENPRAKLLNNLIWLGLGIGIAAILARFGWF
jgi:hypothetical protein